MTMRKTIPRPARKNQAKRRKLPEKRYLYALFAAIAFTAIIFSIMLLLTPKEISDRPDLPKDKECKVRITTIENQQQVSVYQPIGVKCAVKEDCKEAIQSYGASDWDTFWSAVRCE